MTRLDQILSETGWDADSDRAWLMEIARVAREVRAAQKSFYAAAPGTPERHSALRESKTRERQLDSLLNERVSPDLFSVEPQTR
jgi:hypothetical protein